MNIIKPKNDNRNYEFVQLANNMKIILIHDPDTLVGAASMSVNVGFYEDYPKYQGIAHFLEHMLFMGTAKYPNVNHFMSFLNKTGGSTNAYTTGDGTNYYFDVPVEHLMTALDIFGQFFIEPLFNPDTIEKEIDAINAEHSKNYNSDAWKVDRLVREMANENHPYYHFGCGTKKTLDKKDIREKLLSFHATYYSSNIMHLVIYSNTPLAIMKKQVKQIFGRVKNKDVIIEKNYNVFKRLPVTIKSIPVKDKEYLKIYIQITQNSGSNIFGDNQELKYQCLQYIGNLLAHEAKGTLVYHLKKQDLSNSTEVVIDDTDRYLISVMFSVDLTETGYNNLELITSMIYSYINLIKTQGITEWQYQEYRKIAKMTFDYEPRISASNYVISISSSMKLYDIEHILIRNNYYQPYNQKVIEGINYYLSQLIPQNAINIILSKKFVNDESMVADQWFNTKYKIIDDLVYNSQLSKNINFLLPLPNKLVPHNIKIFQMEGSYKDCDISYPRKVISSNNLNVYFKQDQTYNLPFVTMNAILYNNNVYENPKKYISFLIYQDILEETLTKLTSYAMYVNTYFNMSIEEEGIRINIFSYSNSLKYLLSKLINKFLRTEISEKQFQNSKNNLKAELQNFIYAPLIDVASVYFKERISIKYFSTNALIKTIGKVKLRDVENVKALTGNACKCECLIQGNYLENSVQEVIDILEPLIAKEYMNIDTKSIIPIGSGQEEIYTRSRFNPNDKNSYINIFFEIGSRKNLYVTNWDFKYSKLLLLYEMLNEAYFHQLRSIEQSGYIVICRVKNIGSSLVPLWGLQFVIQSINKSPTILKQRIKKFIKNFLVKIQEMTDADFDGYKAACIHILTKPCDNITEEANKNMKYLLEGQNFDYFKKISKLVATLNKEKIIKFYTRHLIDKPTRKIRMLQVFGKTMFV